MNIAVATLDRSSSSAYTETRDFLTIMIGDQIFGIPILQVQDVLGEQTVTRVPLAPKAIAGSLNLRGRIVTAVNVRICLGLPLLEDTGKKTMSVVVESNGELYSLLIDKVGDVMSLATRDFENNPATLDPQWRGVCQGIYRLKDMLLMVLNIQSLLESIEK